MGRIDRPVGSLKGWCSMAEQATQDLPTTVVVQQTEVEVDETQNSPTETSEWVGVESGLKRSHPLFGSLQVEMPAAQLAVYGCRGTCGWAELQDVPDTLWVTVTFKANPAPGVRVLYIKGRQLIDVTELPIPDLRVEVKIVGDWRNRDTISVHQKDEDDVNIVFLREDGMLIQFEPVLLARNKTFWLSVQELTCDQIVRTTRAKAMGLNLRTVNDGPFAALVVPLYPANAYPGADYMKTFPMAEALVRYALDRKAVTPLGKHVVAKWDPPKVELPENLKKPKKGKAWQLAWPMFFNNSWNGGSGYLMCDDGQSCFVYFQTILDKNGNAMSRADSFATLEPMQPVAVRYEQNDRGRKATAVRLLS